MMARCVTLVLLWMCVGTVECVLAQDPDNRLLFNEANGLYQQSEYGRALETYEKIVKAGYVSGILFYNIGNCYFKLGDLGRAILNYERASRLLPHNTDVAANLALSRSLTTDEIVPLPKFWPFQILSWWVHLLPRSWLILVVASGYTVTTGALIVRILTGRRSLQVWATRIAGLGLVVLVVFGVNLAVRELGIGVHEEGVILSREVPVQSAPSDDESLELFTVHEGTKVRIDEHSNEWLEVVLEDGKVGWVKTESLEII
ncbi:MAG: tetratricopeptide repeat protein [Gemmatimonadales bacterium]